MLDGRIVGGTQASIIHHPYQVLLDCRLTLCGGVVLTSIIVLTAAHCFDESPKLEHLSVLAGIDRLDTFTEERKVREVVIHENYNSTVIYDSDVALVVLAKALRFSDRIQKIPLATTSQWKDPKEVLTVTGWGRTETEDLPTQLRQATIHFVENGECQRAYERISAKLLLDTVMFCARSDGMDACEGDSGGPVVWNKQLVGIVSFGKGCALPEFAGVYVDINQFRRWLETTARRLHEKYCVQDGDAETSSQSVA